MPAWPTWVTRLQKAGIALHREKLIRQAKGRPNPLVHKGKGRGTAPHYRGRMQTNVIEQLDMQVLVELESCIHCLYSAKALDTLELDAAT